MNDDEIRKLLDYHRTHYGEWSTLSQAQIEAIGDYFARNPYEHGVFEAEREVTAYGTGSQRITKQTALNRERLKAAQSGINVCHSEEYLKGYLSCRE